MPGHSNGSDASDRCEVALRSLLQALPPVYMLLLHMQFLVREGDWLAIS